jgi:hypothetical protein
MRSGRVPRPLKTSALDGGSQLHAATALTRGEKPQVLIRDSIVSVATGSELDGRGVGIQIPVAASVV